MLVVSLVLVSLVEIARVSEVAATETIIVTVMPIVHPRITVVIIVGIISRPAIVIVISKCATKSIQEINKDHIYFANKQIIIELI